MQKNYVHPGVGPTRVIFFEARPKGACTERSLTGLNYEHPGVGPTTVIFLNVAECRQCGVKEIVTV